MPRPTAPLTPTLLPFVGLCASQKVAFAVGALASVVILMVAMVGVAGALS